MKPAASIIIFTVLSGFGFGLFFWLGLTARTQNLNIQIITFTLAFLLSTIGLVASSFHLGNPQRALLAFTQWRSSWLSREAILAVLTLIFYLLHAVLILFFNLNLSWLGIVCAVFSLLTIFSTAMIYTQMKTVPRWNMSIIPPLFLLYGATGSSVIVESFFLCSFLFFTLGALQVLSWILGDRKFKAISHIGTATGLSNKRGIVRMLEPPHTGTNYLLKEMVFIVAQKHIFKLRLISLLLFSIVPLIISILCIIFNQEHFVFLALAAVINLTGTLISRWLFFAEAEHVVGLYYGR